MAYYNLYPNFKDIANITTSPINTIKGLTPVVWLGLSASHDFEKMHNAPCYVANDSVSRIETGSAEHIRLAIRSISDIYREHILTQADIEVLISELCKISDLLFQISRERQASDIWSGDSFQGYSARQKPFGDSNLENMWNLYPPRYRFTQNHLKYIGTFADARDKPGWIFPTAAKVLVNIFRTDDIDTWIGQVEGCEERGMFFSNSVEPV